MLHLLTIDLKKLIHYRTFWIVCGLYFITLAFSTASGMELLKWLARTVDGFGSKLNIDRIPLYHFPDVWHNLIWFSGLFKVVLAIMVVISVTNEFAYRTLDARGQPGAWTPAWTTPEALPLQVRVRIRDARGACGPERNRWPRDPG